MNNLQAIDLGLSIGLVIVLLVPLITRKKSKNPTNKKGGK